MKQKVIKGVIWSGLQNWGSQAISLLTFLVLARLLSPADFGLVALANTFLVFINIFVDSGFALALIQRHDIEEKHLNTAFWTQICLGFGFSLFGYFNSHLIAEIFQKPELTAILQWFSILFLINSLVTVQRVILKRKLAFKKIAIRAISGIFIGGIVGILLAISGFGVWSLVGQQLTFEIVGVIVFWSLSDWRPKLQFSWIHFKDLFDFGISIFASKIITFFNEHTDNLLIGYFLGEVALGYYAVAYRILQVLTQLLVNTGNQVAFPVLAKLQAEPKKLIRVFYKIIKYAGLIAFPLLLGVIALAEELTINIFGIKWTTSIPIMQVLACGAIVYLILVFNRSVFLAMGKPLWQFRLDMINASCNILACLIAINHGILAVAFAYIISDLLIIPVSLWSLKKLMGISVKAYLKNLAIPMICSLFMLSAILFSKHWLENIASSQMILLICTLLGILLYILALRIIAPLLFQELWQVFHLALLGGNQTKSKS